MRRHIAGRRSVRRRHFAPLPQRARLLAWLLAGGSVAVGLDLPPLPGVVLAALGVALLSLVSPRTYDTLRLLLGLSPAAWRALLRLRRRLHRHLLVTRPGEIASALPAAVSPAVKPAVPAREAPAPGVAAAAPVFQERRRQPRPPLAPFPQRVSAPPEQRPGL